jgi:hypothetical protein
LLGVRDPDRADGQLSRIAAIASALAVVMFFYSYSTSPKKHWIKGNGRCP